MACADPELALDCPGRGRRVARGQAEQLVALAAALDSGVNVAVAVRNISARAARSARQVGPLDSDLH
jgi:hypothetical protein